MKYARLNADGQVECILEVGRRHFVKLRLNGKATSLRRWVESPAPEIQGNQVLEEGPIEVGEFEATRTWVVRDKTDAELAADAVRTARLELRAAAESPAPIPASGEERLARLEQLVGLLVTAQAR